MTTPFMLSKVSASLEPLLRAQAALEPWFRLQAALEPQFRAQARLAELQAARMRVCAASSVPAYISLANKVTKPPNSFQKKAENDD